MSPLKEKAYAALDTLSDDQIGIVLKTIAGLKETNMEPASPFELSSKEETGLPSADDLIARIREYAQTAPEMTLDEINEEIHAARIELDRKKQQKNICRY